MIDDDWEPANDYEDQMDAVQRGLLSYDDTHCVHGTFVGNWAGPDYMCGYCEMGVSDEDFLAGRASAERRDRRVSALKPKLVELIDAVNESARVDPNSPESLRLFKRLCRYIAWRVTPPMEVVRMVQQGRPE